MAIVASPPAEKTSKVGVLAGIAVYWHLFSLDAPTVAALWSWSFARAVRVDLPLLAPLLLAAGTWLVYVADRILDGIDQRKRDDLRLRHRFYSQHRKSFLFAAIGICPIFAWAVCTLMSPVARMEDTAVFVFAALYFLLVHLRSPRIKRWLPKELAVGALFASATAVPAWSRAAADTRLSLIPSILLFAALCWLNCAAIEIWEEHSAQKTFHRTTDWVGQNFSVLARGTSAFACLLALVTFHDVAHCCLYLASGLAALLLQWLTQRRPEMTATQFRVAVDAALLTPLLFLSWMR